MIDPSAMLVERIGGRPVVRLTGEIDLSNAAAIKHSIAEAVSNRDTALVIDLENVSYLDSAGIGMLFDLWRLLASHEQRMVLRIPIDSPVRRSLEVSGWPDHAEMVESVEDAAS